MRTFRNLLRRNLQVLVLVAVGSVVGLCMVLVGARGQSETERQGEFVGEARSSGSSAILAHVNGLPVTEADIAEGRAQASANLEWMKDTISRIAPDSQAYSRRPWPTLAPGEVRMTVNDDGPIPESSGIRRGLEARIAIIEQHGVDTAVWSQAVSDLALFTAAAAAGHSADPADIATRVALVQTALEEGLLPELEGYLSAVGEEVFFSEILPGRLEKEFAVASWRKELFIGITGFEEMHRAWREAERNALSAARVTFTNEPGLDVTIEGIYAYLDAYWAIDVPFTPAHPSTDCSFAVYNQGDKPGLVWDCVTLLEVKDALMGTAALNRSVDTTIEHWDGVTLEVVRMPDNSLQNWVFPVCW